ncbi:type II toxin-antitoxin system YafQ family toxin [Chryseobacterium sp.]|uniref:type II toxin-antitoxin system YafQ family toxin n=1 Tax=Chryseobacterium sp. TaxID=1871047 RepID=UPI002FCBB9EB
MSFSIVPSTRFKKSIKKHLKNPGEKKSIFDVIELLRMDGFDAIPSKMKPHKLIGNFKGCLECHIMPDLLLIWEQDENQKEIYLLDIGSHSDLF